MKKEVISFLLAGAVLASSVAYAADSTTVVKSTTCEKRQVGNYKMMRFGGMKDGLSGMGMGRCLQRASIKSDIFSKLQLTEEQKAKVEILKANEEVIKTLREQLSVKERLTDEERAKKMLENIDTIIKNQETKIETLKAIVEDL